MPKIMILILSIASLSPILFAQTCNSKTPRYTPTSQFEILADKALVLDKKTRLVWQRCALGQQWQNGSCQGTPTKYNFAKAKKAAQTAGSQWRLPTLHELASIAELACFKPAINTTLFPNTLNTYYWSSSPNVNYPNTAWVIYFEYGNDSYDKRKNEYPVRLVRAGQ